MRLRTLIVWVVVLGALGWGAYTILYASSSYIEAGGLIDRVVGEATQRRKAAANAGVADAGRQFVEGLNVAIRAGATRAGLVVSEGDVTVSEGPDGLRVTLRWSFPVVVVGGETYLSIPMSVTRAVSPNL